MKTYVEQLLEDIRAAHRVPEQSVAIGELRPWESDAEREAREFAEHMEEVERFVAEDPPQNFSYHCGLLKEEFPPVEQLSDTEVAALVDRFSEMLQTWNVRTDIPQELSRRVAYDLLISLLDERIWIFDFGNCNWSFCDGEPANCVFGAHCTCREFIGEAHPDAAQSGHG